MDTEASKQLDSVPAPIGLSHANPAAKHTHTACPLRIKQVGHTHHRPQGALHE